MSDPLWLTPSQLMIKMFEMSKMLREAVNTIENLIYNAHFYVHTYVSSLSTVKEIECALRKFQGAESAIRIMKHPFV